MSESVQAAIRTKAKELLERGEVGCVVGYELGPRGRIRPAFVYEPDDAERLVWGDQCHHNLMVFLHDRKAPPRRGEKPQRVAVVAKPCDVRALNVLLHEGQIERDRVFVIGVACAGMCQDDPSSSPGEAGVLEARCGRCAERVPVFYDVLVGEPPAVDPPAEDWADVVELEGMTVEERRAFWAREFDRCIRCYACRQSCPGCYCFECMAEQVDPPWMGIAIELPEKAFFHVMRAYHLAGRCVECNACGEACPMDIPLSLLNRKLAKEVEDLFDFRAGGDPDTPPPLATFRKDEELPL
ncbi:MAG TPA: 4Fe-4S dicluster domain-containing protein [Anaerolineae bacterium]|nr:4Fe-4S dicluster domain-containing protein [Anaerolineae bacterium]